MRKINRNNTSLTVNTNDCTSRVRRKFSHQFKVQSSKFKVNFELWTLNFELWTFPISAYFRLSLLVTATIAAIVALITSGFIAIKLLLWSLASYLTWIQTDLFEAIAKRKLDNDEKKRSPKNGMSYLIPPFTTQEINTYCTVGWPLTQFSIRRVAAAA